MHCSPFIYTQRKGTLPEDNSKYLQFCSKSYSKEVLFLLSPLITEGTKAKHCPSLAGYGKCLILGGYANRHTELPLANRDDWLYLRSSKSFRINLEVMRFCCHFLIYIHIYHIFFFLIPPSEPIPGKLHCEVKVDVVQPFGVFT